MAIGEVSGRQISPADAWRRYAGSGAADAASLRSEVEYWQAKAQEAKRRYEAADHKTTAIRHALHVQWIATWVEWRKAKKRLCSCEALHGAAAKNAAQVKRSGGYR